MLLLALAAWLATAGWRWPARLLVAAGFAAALFFTHLLVTAVYGLVLGVMRLDAFRRDRRLDAASDVPLLGQLLVLGALWAMVGAPTHGTETVFGPPMARLRALVSPVLYFQDFDFVLGLALLAWPLAAVAAVGLVMPEALLGVWLTHIRVPVIAALMLIAAAEPRFRDRRERAALIAALAILAAAKLAKVEQITLACGAKQQAFLAALAPLERGARILPVMEPADELDCFFAVYWHMPSLAVVEKSAFNPLMKVAVWPLEMAPALRRLAPVQPRPASPRLLVGDTRTFADARWNREIAANWRRDFDYLVWLHPGTDPRVRPGGLTPVGGGDFFTLYRIAGPP